MKFLKPILVVVLMTVVIAPGVHAQKKDKKNKKDKSSNELVLNNQNDTVSYALGLMIAPNLKAGGLNEINFEAYVQAIKDFMEGKDLAIKLDTSRAIVNGYVMGKIKEEGEANLKIANEFLEKNKEKKGVITTESGLQYEILVEGNGAKPTLSDEISAHYHGTLMDGTIFDSSVERGEPVSFPVSGVIKGWTEALQLMGVGSKWKLYIPPHLGYGEQSPPGSSIKPNDLLIFEVELISIK